MLIQGRYIPLLIVLGGCLSGCLGGLWTGASLVYDRHHVYKKINDYHLLVEINNALNVDKKFKNEDCVIDVATFNGDILLAGHVPSEDMLLAIKHRIAGVTGYRRLFNLIKISNATKNSTQDSWITTKIRSQIFADDSIDPDAFKVVTSDSIVYLMGDVKPEEAKKVITISRFTSGVAHVVKILKYFTYETVHPDGFDTSGRHVA